MPKHMSKLVKAGTSIKPGTSKKITPKSNPRISSKKATNFSPIPTA